jgi:hypothetical protein
MAICLNFNISNAPARDLRAAVAKPVIDLQTFQSPCSIDQATNRASRPVIFPSTIRRQAENYTVRLHAALWRRSESSAEGIHSGTTQVAQSAIPPSVSGLGKVKIDGALAGRHLLPYLASLIGRAGGHTTHGFQGFQGCWHFQGCCFEAEKSHATLVLITACARAAHYVLYHPGPMVKHSCSLHTLTHTLHTVMTSISPTRIRQVSPRTRCRCIFPAVCKIALCAITRTEAPKRCASARHQNCVRYGHIVNSLSVLL